MEIFNKTVENATVKVTEQGGKITIDVTDIPKYKAGDILAARSGVFIYKGTVDRLVYHYCYVELIHKVINFEYDNPFFQISDIRGYATINERQRLFDELAKVGKRWNSDQLCIEDIPKPLKVGDMVIAWGSTRDMSIIGKLKGIDNDAPRYFVGDWYFVNAIKWDGTREQYEKILNG